MACGNGEEGTTVGKEERKKFFNVDFRQYFQLYFCRIGHRFEHNQVNVDVIFAKTQGTWFNLSCLAGQQNKRREIVLIMDKGNSGIQICN